MQKINSLFILFLTAVLFARAQNNTTVYHEQYRPQIHFSPQAHWMNDPNGMVYNNGIYHLFYQYYPDSSVWGPMHWAHATSADLVHWTHQPIALYPDSLGLIFSGSAVVDKNNTSGFGKGGKAPLVAIYTSHDMAAEKSGKNDFERQAIAYSLDGGKTWTKYAGNPVLPNQGIRDFRDPKVMWYEQEKKWIMILAVKDHAAFYSSPDLKNWMHESDFGSDLGAHGGVWECPDFFTLSHNGKEVWVVTCSINPGAPNGGSATQYFTGSFDGKTFTPNDTTTKWMDYGTDNYAGVTWGNVPGNRRISLGWMSNWNYATKVPTEVWRSANTLPRNLALKEVAGGKLYLTSMPVKELDNIAKRITTMTNMDVSDYIIGQKITSPYRLSFTSDMIKDFSFTFSNEAGEQLVAGYDKAANQFYIDRTKAGEANFNKNFAAKHTAPRLSDGKRMNVTIIIDAASIELFADDGLSVMTDIFFPKSLLNQIHIQSPDKMTVDMLQLYSLQSIWK